MSTLDWILIALILLGVVPAWLFAIAAFMSSRKPYPEKPSARYFAYARLLDALHSGFSAEDSKISNGALFVAMVREFKNYPEFRDVSLLYLEEINITGSSKFDDVMREEIKTVEAHLLEPPHE